MRLGADLCVLVVSGSNMSGKSTLLRTVGINTVLAMAGAPVRARQLRLSPLTVGAAIRILDSLQDGSSRFYAEITRLRRLLDLTGKSPPLLFLLDGCCTTLTLTTAASAPRPSSGTWSSAVPSACSPPTT